MPSEKPVHPFLTPVPPARYARNFLRQVVCELRFPTLFDLNSSVPHLEFAHALRKIYPHHSHQVTATDVNGGAYERTHTHIFKSKNLDWSVSLSQSAITVETTKYTHFSDLVERINFLTAAATDVIDSDFFTRIGLRYINIVPMNLVDGDTTAFKGWIRDSLVGVIVDENLGVVHEYASRVAGQAEFGTFLFQHGVGYNSVTKNAEYFLDFDFAKENVEIADVATTLDELHRNEFAMFQWTLGPKGKGYLGDSILNGGVNV